MLQPTFKLEYNNNQPNFPTSRKFYPFFILDKIQPRYEFAGKTIVFPQTQPVILKRNNIKDYLHLLILKLSTFIYWMIGLKNLNIKMF